MIFRDLTWKRLTSNSCRHHNNRFKFLTFQTVEKIFNQVPNPGNTKEGIADLEKKRVKENGEM